MTAPNPPTNAAADPPALHAAELAAYHDQARRAAEQVLAGPEFADMREAGTPRLLALLEWLAGWLEGGATAIADFFDRLPTWLWWALLIWMVLALAAILAHMAWMLVRTLGARARPHQRFPAAHAHQTTLFGITLQGYQALHDRAEQLLRAGDWLAAARYLYVAALMWLAQTGRLTFHPAKTNRDYLREIAPDPALAERFGQLTRTFESVAYGGLPADRAACQRMHQDLNDLRNEVALPATR